MKVILRTLVFAAVLLSQETLAQDSFSPWYVVIGGFKNEDNAKRQCVYAHEQNLPAVYAFNAERQMYYVYVRATQTREVAEDIVGRLRTGTVFRDAWVFNGALTGTPFVAKAPPAPPKKPAAPVVSAPGLVPEVEENELTEVEDDLREEAASASPEHNERSAPVGKPFRFAVMNRETGNAVSGLVRLFEDERSNQFKGYTANETVYVPAPANKAKTWLVYCHVPGYRPYKTTVDYEEIKGADEAVIQIELQRVKRGDYIEMEGVKFYNNAALLTPGSERALDDLVAMLEENMKYRIRLHGHTNGTHPRDIVSLGASQDLFNPSVDNEKRHVSAKELALLRAEIVKTYLVRKGIDASRISTKGEGGTQMIYDPRGTLAGLNDRVEVEIRKH